MDELEVLTRGDLGRVLRVSKRTVDRLQRRPDFPKPFVVFGSRSLRWRRQDVLRWIEARAAEAQTQEAPARG